MEQCSRISGSGQGSWYALEYICMDYPLDGYGSNWLKTADSRERNWGSALWGRRQT